jgi:hypothetical protein
MKTHNALLYHCLKCGSVAHIDFDAAPPRCCGREMARAAVETVCDEDNSELLASQRHAPQEAANSRNRAR